MHLQRTIVTTTESIANLWHNGISSTLMTKLKEMYGVIYQVQKSILERISLQATVGLYKYIYMYMINPSFNEGILQDQMTELHLHHVI